MHSRHGRKWTAALVGLVAVVTAACSSSSAKTSGAGASTPAANTASTASTLPDDPATGEPIKIGFVNNEGAAAFTTPELSAGSKVAVDLLNQKLKGINGRPLDVVRCISDGSPEKSIACANQFVEAHVVVVQEGVDVGADAMLPILKDAGIPLVGHVQFGPARMFDPHSYYFGAAAIAYGGAALKFYKDQGVHSIEWFFGDVPSSHAFTDGVLMPTAQQLGLDYKTVYYDPANPNWSVLAATTVADNPDVSGALAAIDSQCTDLITALLDAGYKGKILGSSCQKLYASLGDKAVGVDVDFDHWNADPAAAPADKQKDLQLYSDAMTAAGQADQIHGNAFIGFADTMTLASILRTITGTVDGKSVEAALMATKNAESFGGPKITCDHTVMPGNSACAAGLLFVQIQSDGSYKQLTPDFVSGIVTPAG